MDRNRNATWRHFMSINYTYEIISVDEQARCMEIVYRADGHPTQHVGARLPYQGEALIDVVSMYAPVAYWQSLIAPVSVPSVGTMGVAPVPSFDAQAEEDARNREMWDQVQYERKLAKALIKFGLLTEDPTKIQVTHL